MKVMKQKIFTLLVMVMVAMTASAEKGYKLTKGTNPHGTTTIKVGDKEAEYAAKGATVTIVVTPEEGHSIATVYGVLYTTWDGAKTRGLQVGDRIVAAKVKDTDNTYSFEMPEYNVEINVSYIETVKVESKEAENEEKDVDNVQVGIEVAGDPEIVDGQVIVPVVVSNVIVPNQADATETNKKDITVEIPQTQTGANGVTYKVVGIKKDLFEDKPGSDCQVTKVILPPTEEPINIEEGAMQPNGRVLEVVAPLEMLDNYATMESLQENFAASKISATVTAPNKYWTFSSGVDCVLPEGVTVYKAVWGDGQPRIELITKDELEVDGKRIIKANNGVLIASEKGNAYEIVANPGNQDSKTKLDPEKDANSYAGNCLMPTIDKHQYTPALPRPATRDNGTAALPLRGRFRQRYFLYAEPSASARECAGRPEENRTFRGLDSPGEDRTG